MAYLGNYQFFARPFRRNVSTRTKVSAGVSQSRVLSSLLFLIYIIDKQVHWNHFFIVLESYRIMKVDAFYLIFQKNLTRWWSNDIVSKLSRNGLLRKLPIFARPFKRNVSTTAKVNTGVSESSVLSSLLFLIYIINKQAHWYHLFIAPKNYRISADLFHG